MDSGAIPPAKIVELVPGIQREELFDGRIMILTVTTQLAREIVDVWFDTVSAYSDSRAGAPSFLVYDALQVPMVMLSPYFRHRITELAKATPDATGRVAIIMPVTEPFRSLVQLFLSRMSKRLQPHLDVKMFNDREQGVSWVIEGLRETGEI